MAMEQNKWQDISCETERSYLYADGETLRIERPKRLHVAPSSMGGHAHRVETEDGKGYYIAPGWVAIRWTVADGLPVFKF